MSRSVTTLTPQDSVSQWIIEKPARPRIFEQLGIDYCCGGKKPLAQACAARGLNPADLLAQLETQSAQKTEERDWSQAPLAELVEHIEQTHHAWLKRELPRLAGLIAKVSRAHGQRHPKVVTLHDLFTRFAAEMDSHMFKEERILFPRIVALETSAASGTRSLGNSGPDVDQPIAIMEHEHDDHGRALQQIGELTDNFSTPSDVCNTYRAMIDGLDELKRDTHQHIHKENNILFPRASALAQKP